MTPGDFGFRSRVSKFISGSSSRSRFGFSTSPKFTNLSSIIPKRTLPQQILERIQQKPTSEVGDGVESTLKQITHLGKVTLNLEQTKNNLEKILEIIADDYKNTQEQNKKESDEYRKRIANRGRILGKKELGDRKSDILGTVKKYVGSFFSGAGGAIRALAMFNLLQGVLSGDPSKIIKSLLGIGLTYIPNIIGAVIGGVIGGVGKGLLGRLFRGRGGASGPPLAAVGEGVTRGSRLGSLVKFGGKASLLAGGIAAASSLFNRPEDGENQQRLEQLTEQQKGLNDPANLVTLPQDDLKRFERLNKKFEEALDFLLKKQKEDEMQSQRRGGSNRGSSGSSSGGSGFGDPSLRGSVSGDRFTVEQIAFMAKQVGFNDQDAAFMAAVAMEESSGDPSIDTVKSGLDPQMRKEYSIGLAQINWKAHQGWLKEMGITNPDQLRDPITNLQAAYRLYQMSGGFSPWSAARKVKQSNVDKALETLRSGRNPLPSQPQSPPPSRPSPITPRAQSSRDIPPLSSAVAFSVLPILTDTPSQSPTSTTSGGNEVVADVNTAYSDNLLTLYPKLTYQIIG